MRARHGTERLRSMCWIFRKKSFPAKSRQCAAAFIRSALYSESALRLQWAAIRKIPNVIEVIEIACDECPMGGYDVTEACRGCLAHRCEDVCRRGAITFDSQQKAHIDKTKCVECGQCAKVCPYSAIINFKRPCMSACKVNAISMTEDQGCTA